MTTSPGEPGREGSALDNFNRMDINKDGVLSGTELKGVKRGGLNDPRFTDGKITKDEYLSSNSRSRRAGSPTGPGSGPVRHPGPGSGLALDQGKLGEVFFNHLDKNADGVLSGNEIRPRHKAKDADGDGQLTLDEYRSPTAVPALFRVPDEGKERLDFNLLDKNQDGVLSGNEIRPRDKAKDADGDGQLTLDEFKLAAPASTGDPPRVATLGIGHRRFG